MKQYDISLQSLPTISFAHEYSTENYDITFPPQPNFIEISYNLEGEVEMTDGNGKVFVPEGSLSVNIRETGSHCKCKGRQHHITVGFGVQFCKGDDLILPHFLPPPIGEKFKKRIRHIIDEFTVTRTTTVKLAGDILLLLSDISAEYQKIKETGNNYGNFFYVEKAKQYIAAHIDQKLYVSDVAEGVGLSVGYLSNIFRHVTGQTLVEFINRTKLARVKELTERGLTIKEAGNLTGYDDENYVSRIYKKYFGKNLTGRNKKKKTDFPL